MIKQKLAALTLLMVSVSIHCIANSRWDEFNNDNREKYISGNGKTAVAISNIKNNLYVLTGIGGNIALLTGKDGVFLVDSGSFIFHNKLLEAINTLAKGEPRFMVSTHWHIDHSGGIQGFNKLGTITIAHENVKARLSTDQIVKMWDYAVPASPPSALPITTFTDEMTLRWNGDEIRLIHPPNAHTDGDTIVYFADLNVIGLGDIYWSRAYPSIDTGTGGTMKGMIKALDTAISLANENTTIIPGHGEPTAKKELVAYRDMLVKVYDRVRKLKAQGMTLNQIIAAKPTADLDEQWGKGAWKPDSWIMKVVFNAVDASR